MRFQDAKSRCEDLDVSVINEILKLNLFQLRGIIKNDLKFLNLILDALQNDKYNAQTVLKAYSWKALQVQDQINCLAEFLIEAFEKAEELDKKYSGKENKPPLYGIPFSVKANFFVS